MDTKPRILFVLPLPPPMHGASAVSESIRSSRDVNDSFDCEFISLTTSSRIDKIGKASLTKLPSTFAIYLKVFWRLLTRRYDLCYVALTCHGKGFLKDAPIALLCKLFSKRLLIHQHNKGMSDDVHKWPYRWLFPAVYRRSKVMLLSSRLYDDVSAVVTEDQVIVCPNGIEDIKASSSDHDGTPTVLFLSNLLAAKGIHVFIEACGMLKSRGVSFRGIIAGAESSDLSAAGLTESLSRHGLRETVEYLGPVYGDAKEKCWSRADVFVLPTMNECFPLVLLEAMQHSVPVITTAQGGIPDIVLDGKTGYVLPENTAENIADRIQFLLEHPQDRTEMGEAGRSRYEELFTRDKFIKRFIECLREACK